MKQVLIVIFILLSCVSVAQENDSLSSLLDKTLEELMDIKVVSAAKTDEKAVVAPASIYIVTEKDIIKNGYFSLKDVLENIPGFETIDLGFFLVGGQRGYLGNFSQTLLLVNGREIQNILANEMFISNQFATHNIKQIEIIQGPGSALYGANAMLGVINIITKNDQADYNKIEVHAEYGSQNTKSQSIVFGKTFNKFRISGSTRLYSSDMWDFSDFVNDSAHFWGGKPRIEAGVTNGEHRYQNTSSSIPLSLKASFDITNHLNIYAGRESYYTKSGKGLENVALKYDRQSDIRNLAMHFAGFEYRMNENNKLVAEYQHYNEKIKGVNTKYYGWTKEWHDYVNKNGTLQINGSDSVYLPPHNPITDDEIYKYHTEIYSNEKSPGSKRDNAYVQLNSYSPQLKITSVAGYRFDYTDAINVTGNWRLGYANTLPPVNTVPADTNPDRQPNYKYYKQAAYLQIQRPLLNKKLYVTLGGRYTYHNFLKGAYTFRSGLVYALRKETHIKVLFGQAFRDPALFELKVDTLGQTNVKPARINTYEIGISHNIKKNIIFNMVGFFNQATDFIENKGTVTFTNSHEIKETAGLESQIYIRYNKWHGDINYSFVQPVNTTSNTESLNIYQNMVNGSINYDVLKKVTLNVRANYRDGISAVSGSGNGEIIKLKPYTLFHFTTSVNALEYNGTKIILMLSVKNIFNSTVYQPNIRTSGPIEFQLPGRQYLARLLFEF